MKKHLLTFLSFFTSRFLQILLSVLAYYSWLEAINIGHMFTNGYDKLGDVRSTSGFNGGAIAMGLITCVCILGVVVLEINRSKKP